jgi:probable F420-dependent oxidoreductase
MSQSTPSPNLAPNLAPNAAPDTAHDRARGLGRVGIWSTELRFGDPGQAQEAAAELEELGYGALWFPGGVGGDVFGDFERLLRATRRVTIATGIINIWKHEPAEIGDWWAGLPAADQARSLLGLGVSHGPLIGEAWGKPLEAMGRYLDGLDAAGVPAERRCLAALGPKMLDLSRDRSAGAHPYLVTVQHTAQARERLGPDALLAPEVGVILETDAAQARDKARGALTNYLRLPNYVNSWRRQGFTDEDLHGSDRLIDALFGWGTVEQIAARVREHLAAGADHVCLQVIEGAPGQQMRFPRDAWRELAGAVL